MQEEATLRVSNEKESMMSENSLLQDFITETGEHLEETERNLLHLEQHPDDIDTLNSIFRSVHTIKGSSEYLGLEGIARLSHQLESLLELLRRQELSADATIIDLMIGCNDRIGVLVGELDLHEEEKTPVDDLVTQLKSALERSTDSCADDSEDVFGDDEVDEELFGIFTEQLRDGLCGLIRDVNLLGRDATDSGLLTKAADRLSTLRSSSNYMGYEALTKLYDNWAKEVDDTINLINNNLETDTGKFIHETMLGNINRVKEMFPKIEFDPVDVDIYEDTDDSTSFDDEFDDSGSESEHSLLEDFILESVEHLEDTNRNLLHLEQHPDDGDTLNKIFRSIHTIKGSSEYLGVDGIAALSHKLESLLEMLRRKERAVDGEVIELIKICSERISALISELGENQKEQTSVDDLVLRLKQIMEQTKAASDVHQDGSLGEDEYDEELFGIFIEQLREGFNGLGQDAEQMQKSGVTAAVLEQSAKRLVTLRSSSNYMGYDSLTEIYDKWAQQVDQAVKSINDDQEVDPEEFIRETMLANLDKVKTLFPKVSIEEVDRGNAQKDKPFEKPEDKSAGEGVQGDDPGIIDEFISETGEHLDETGRNLLQLEQQPNDIDLLNEIFRSVHTIKGSSEYLGMEHIAALAHKLEGLLDMLRHGERSVESSVIDLLINCNDRIGALVDQIDNDRDSTVTVDDLLVKLEALLEESDTESKIKSSFEKLEIQDDSGVVYAEEYDQELFSIFLEQFNNELDALTDEIDNFRSEEFLIDALERTIERLGLLRSSANYMEYDELVVQYDDWIKRSEETLVSVKEGNKPDIENFIHDVMLFNIDNAKKFFCSIESDTAEQKQQTEPELNDLPDKQQTKSVAEDADGEDSEILTLEDVVEQGDVAKLEPLPSSGDDSELLNKLADAFESRLGLSDIVVKQYFNETVENNLFSEDRPETMTGEGPPVVSKDTSHSGYDVVDVKDVESLLFTGIGAGGEKKETKLPKPVISDAPEQVQPGHDFGQKEGFRRPRQKIGRRQSDKFRDRMIKQSIRVDAAKIDELMNQVGELVVSRSGFYQLQSDIRQLQLTLKQSQKLDSKEMQAIKMIANKISDATTSLGRVTSDLQENVMKVRMLPIAQLFSRYPRVVHDLVRSTNKKVNLEIYGEETELDKKVIEQLTDPLIHIIRNAVDHGIEDTAVRLQKGKDETGTIRMEAFPESNYVVIEISDDGQGIDTEKIKTRALEKKLVTIEEADQLTEQQLLSFIMRPGFSTAQEVTHTSGRGVGMDVVKDNIEKINGTIKIISSVGSGARFQIKIPLTLAIIPALLVRVVNEIFTIPLSAVDETIRIHQSDISTIEGLEVYDLRGSTIPLIRLNETLKMGSDDVMQDDRDLFVVILKTGVKQVGFIVDELKSRQEVVIKPLEDYLQEKSGFSGATILGDGSISLIIDVFEMVRISLNQKVAREKAATL
jgi:two-component system chemotaxis sensor kinase CheA